MMNIQQYILDLLDLLKFVYSGCDLKKIYNIIQTLESDLFLDNEVKYEYGKRKDTLEDFYSDFSYSQGLDFF